MSKKTRIAVVGLGKMGLSHFSMINAHPDVAAVACDSSGFMTDVLEKYIAAPVHRDYDAMLASGDLDAVVIATPSRLHEPMVAAALDAGLHVFCEKPFCLDFQAAARLADRARAAGLVNQVGYHYRFVGAFREMKRIVDSGALGRITHVLAEAYGPVVLRSKRQTWRTDKAEGGGCLYDYAAHPLNLLNWFFGDPVTIRGSVMNSVFSGGIDDEVFSTLQFEDGPTAQLSVNWSDESHRKMSTKISMIGTGGRVQADRQECQTYLRAPHDALPGYVQGWNVKYTTELTEDPYFYLRGEEYSNQLDDFVKAIRSGSGQAADNDFASAAMTDKTIAGIIANAGQGDGTEAASATGVAAPARRRGWFSRS